jgi:hypothetical protein
MKRILPILTCILFACTQVANATDRTWTGAGAGGSGTVFNTAANWSPAGTPGSADNLTINLTTGASVTITLSGSITVGSLTIFQNRSYYGSAIADNFNLNGNALTVTGDFELTNHNAGFNASNITVTIPSSTLAIGGNCTVTNTNSYAWFFIPLSAVPKQTAFSNSGTVTVAGTTNLNSENASTASAVSFLTASNTANYIFTGNVILDDGSGIASNTVTIGVSAAGGTGKFTFKGNVTAGKYAQTNAAFTSGTILLDGAVSQTITYNNTVYNFNIPNLVIGSSNNPVITLSGKTATDDILGDLTLNGSSVLDLGTCQWNRQTTGGTFKMNGTSKLKLAGSSSVKNGTAATNTGSNFPSGFSSYSMDLTNNCATVEYYGADQTIFGGLDYGSLIMSGSGTITAPGGTINIYKFFNKSSAVTFKHNNGTIIFTGNYNPKIYAASPVPDFYNLGLSGGNPELVNEIGVAGTLTLNMSNFNINANINLRSTASKTANVIYTAGNLGYGSGRFVAERYVASGRKWRFLAVPTNGENTQTIRSAWQEGATAIGTNPKPGYGMQVTDNKATYSANGFDAQSVSGPSVKYWNGTGYTGVPSTTQALQNLTGYAQTPFTAFMCFVRGDRTALSTGSTIAATTLRTTGKIYTGDQTVTIQSGNLYQAIGNPYASAVSLKLTPYTGVIANTFYVWDPKLTGAYGLGAFQTVTLNGSNYTVSPGGGSYPVDGSANNLIQSGSAFFVKGSGGTMNFKESSKDNSSAAMQRAQQGELPVVRANLFLRTADATELLDGTAVIVDPASSNNIDNDDATKMVNTSENVSIRKGDSLIATERRKLFTANDTMFLNLTGVRAADYQWKIYMDDIELRNCAPFMVDKFTNTTTALSVSDTNAISFSIQNIAGSYAADRFMIVFKPAAVVPVTFVTVSAVRNNDKNVNVKWNIENEINIASYNIEYSTDGRTFTTAGTKAATGTNAYSYMHANAPLSNCYYRIKATDNDGRYLYSAIVKVNALADATGISVYPNPVENKQMNVVFTKKAAGHYNVRLINAQGQVVYSNKITVTGTNEAHTLQVGDIAAGVYQLSVADEDNVAETQSVIIR